MGLYVSGIYQKRCNRNGSDSLHTDSNFARIQEKPWSQKTPLLRSMEAINKQALRLLRLFGNTTSQRVTPSVGAEQEYIFG